MDILKHALPIKSLIFFKLNCHAKMAPDTGHLTRAGTRYAPAAIARMVGV